MHEIDFLPVENEDNNSTHSGDAIAMRFSVASDNRPKVVVIDGGYTLTGDALVDHIIKYYDTTHVDLVISTHPDVDHINGLKTVLERLSVGELFMHQPWKYRPDGAKSMSNYEATVGLYNYAVGKGIPVTQPFTGVSRYGDALQILGPSELRYVTLLDQMIAEAQTGAESARFSAFSGGGLVKAAARVLEQVIASFPIETLRDDDDSSPRNQSSAITLVRADDLNLLFTGDAGIESLNLAIDYYEETVGSLVSEPINFFQAPHHGSKHNLGPTILNRLFGSPSQPRGRFTSFVSSAKSSEKHPSAKVTNALGRRGGVVAATEGQAICFGSWVARSGWTSLAPVPPLQEDND